MSALEYAQIYWEALRDTAKVPTKAHHHDAGWDLYVSETIIIEPREHRNVSTHIAIALPIGWFGHLLPRSSTLPRHNLIVTPAVIDCEYRGELFIQATNRGDDPVYVEVGMRIAQLLILPVPVVEWTKVKTLTSSTRGHHGFGSTGG